MINLLAYSYKMLPTLARELVAMLFRIWAVLLTILLLTGIGIGLYISSNPFGPSHTFYINKAAELAGLTPKEHAIIEYPSRYLDNYTALAINQPFPRILLTQLRNWSGSTPAHFFTRRLAEQQRRGERIRIDCDASHLYLQLSCLLSSPTKERLARLQTALENYPLAYPNLAGNYGNGWLLALMYDIANAHPGFSQTSKAVIELKIKSLLEHHLTLLDGESASLWHGRSTLAASAYLLATALDLSTNGHKQLYSRAYGHFKDAADALTLTETWPEGYNYWLQERGFPIALALSALKNMATDPTEKQRITTLMRRIGRWHLYLTRPDNRIEGWGDEGSRVDLKDGSRRIIDVLAQASQDPLLADYSLYLKNLYPTSSYYSSNHWLIPILNDPFISATEPATVRTVADITTLEPAAMLFGKDASNHLVIRSGWGNDDTFISFRASDIYTHHQHYDAGHFSLFKGEPLASNSSTYADFFSDHRLNYAIRSIAKNTLLIIDPTEKVKPNKHFKTNINDGGQRIVIPTGSALTSLEHWQSQRFDGKHYGTSELLAYEHLEGVATYIKTDLTRAYNSVRFDGNGGDGKVSRVTRSLLYLNQEDALIIYDEVITTKPEFTKKWLLHTYEPFNDQNAVILKGVKDNGIIQSKGKHRSLTSRHSNSTLTMDVLLPEMSQLTQIGGPDYRYYVETDGDDQTLDGANQVAGSSAEKWFDQPQWRTELSPIQAQTENKFLVVLQPRTGDTKALEVMLEKATDTAKAVLTVGSTLLVLEPKCGAIDLRTDNTAKRAILLSSELCSMQVIKNEQPVKTLRQGKITIFDFI
ncbi:MAG: hypothetical protein V7677_14650 [Motiliproteus sp.]